MKAIILLILPFFLMTYPYQGMCSLPEEDQQKANPKHSSDLNLNKKLNIKTNIANAAFGIYNLSFDYKINSHFSVSATGIIGQFDQKSKDKVYTFEVKTKGFNLMANYHFNEVYTNSFYVAGFAGSLLIDVELVDFSVPASAEIKTLYAGAEVGYVYYWNRLNFTVGAGGSKTSKDEEAKIKFDNLSGTASVQVHLNYHINASIGYVF